MLPQDIQHLIARFYMVPIFLVYFTFTLLDMTMDRWIQPRILARLHLKVFGNKMRNGHLLVYILTAIFSLYIPAAIQLAVNSK